MQLYHYLEIEEKNKFNAKATDHKIKRFENQYSIPFQYVKLQLCKLFNCLPSELENENYSELMELLTIDNAIEVYKSWQYDEKKLPTHLKLHLEILKLEKALGLDHAK